LRADDAFRQKISGSTSPPRERRPQPREQTDEAPGLIEKEQVDVEREIPIEDEDNESVERGEPRDQSDPPLFED
jgi:hypothetical protein